MGEPAVGFGGSGDSLWARWRGALCLSPATFAAAARDRRALGQAALTVMLGGLARGLGAFEDEAALGLLSGVSIGILVWVLAAAGVWWIGVEWLGHASELPGLLRALGLAATPLLALALCGLLPQGPAAALGAGLHAWAALCFAAAVRAALGVSALRALGIAALALALSLLLLGSAASFLFDPVFLD